MKETYGVWLRVHRNFPKVERLGIGQKIEQAFLDTLELMFSASYLPPERKLPLLERAAAKIDAVKFFMQLAWENKLMTTEKYSELAQLLETVGRMLGGWRKGLQSKTPTLGRVGENQ